VKNITNVSTKHDTRLYETGLSPNHHSALFILKLPDTLQVSGILSTPVLVALIACLFSGV